MTRISAVPESLVAGLRRWPAFPTPFPSPVTEIGTPKGGALYRYEELMGFFSKMKLL